MEEEGKILILSSPSGAGRNAIAKKLVQYDSRFIMAVSAITRAPRAGEIDTIDYFFKTRAEFMKMIKNKEFLECIEYSGNLYGTSKDFVERKVGEGKVVIYTVTFEGLREIKKRARCDVVSVFVMPPSFAELKNILEARGTDTPEEIEKKLELAKRQIEHKDEYDAVIINEDIDLAVRQIINLVEA